MTQSTTSPSEPSSPDTLAEALSRHGVDIDDPGLLARAMAHRSHVAETLGTQSNERLEFLGDAVLGWIVADLAFRRFGALAEGDLTSVRKGVVNATALAEVATSLELGRFVMLGKGEDAAGGRGKVSILSDAMEAVVGAVYVHGGPARAYEFVERLFGPRLDAVVGRLDDLDYKSRLQELLAREGHSPPRYLVRSEGPDHAKRFSASVTVDGEVVGTGEGGSKKAAEQVAATAAVSALTSQPPDTAGA